MNLSNLWERLNSPQTDQQGQVWAFCPCHDDGTKHKRRSLSLAEKDGKLLVYCFAGCKYADITKALGLDGHSLPKLKQGRREPEAVYGYQDETGKLLFQVCRFPNKQFLQRRPDGRGGWSWNLDGVRRVLYRLPEVLAAVQKGETVFIPEGEKDVHSLVGLGLVATCNPGGAGKWRDEYSEHLRGASVVVLSDSDEPGHNHAQQMAKSLHGIAASVRVLELPGLPDKGDVTDWLQAGGTREKLLALASECKEWMPVDNVHQAQGAAEGKKKRPSQAQVLIEAANTAKLFHDEQREPFACIPVGGHQEIYRLRDRAFKRWLTRQVYASTGLAVNTDALAQALNLLEARATFDGPCHPLALRVAERDGVFYYDLGDSAWRAVAITPDGWQCLDRPPIIFWRSKNLAAQVEPVSGGDPFRVLEFVNLRDEPDKLLLLVYLVTSLVPGVPHPQPVFTGGQGAAKSTTARVCRRLIDPAIEDLLSMPNDPSELGLLLSSNYAPYFDNLDGLRPWQSDLLCRAITGGGVSKRRLYTDDEEIVLRFLRCVALNGISGAATRPDLLDRSIIFNLERVNPDARREESSFWAAFEAARPAILGGLLDALAGAMRIYPQAQLTRLPRMADFTRWGYAAAEALGVGGARFLDAYGASIGQQNDVAIQNHPVAAAVAALLEDAPSWTGNSSDLLTALEKIADEVRIDTKSRAWPRAANALTRRLREAKSNLADAGINLTFDERSARRRNITFQRVAKISSLSSLSSFSNNNGGLGSDGIDDDIARPEKISSLISSSQESSNDAGCDDNDGNDGFLGNLRVDDDLTKIII
jgi:hypothetical protein